MQCVSMCLIILAIVFVSSIVVNSSSTESVEAADKSYNDDFVPAASPTNLTVTVSALNASKPLLQLNISWIPSKDGHKPSSYNIHIWPLNETDAHCYTEPYYAFVDSADCSAWTISPEVTIQDHPLPITPGCSYRLRLEANPYDGTTHTELNYTVPECVDGVCSCRHAWLLPKPELQVEQITEHSVNITWNISDYLNISSFLVRVGPKLLEGSHSSLYNLTWIHVVAAEQTSVNYEVQEDGQYAAAVAAVDVRECSGPEEQIAFTVENKTNTQEFFSVKEIIWKIILPFGVFAILFCAFGSAFSHRIISWVKHKKQTAQIAHQVFFYKPVSVKSLKVFRRSDSLQERNILYVEKEIEDAKERGEADNYEISYNRLKFEREIGRGAFGQVFLAKAEAIRGVPGSRSVAVKKLKTKAGPEEREEFLEEISMLKRVGRHPNIVCLLACVTLGEELCMVMEYVPCGDLRNYLRVLRRQLEARKISESSMSDMYSTTSTAMTNLSSQNYSPVALVETTGQNESVLDHRELQNFALQVARGMAHLEAKRITHRDLAARNILISDQKVLKISDFGLSRRGVYVNTRRCKVPLRWLSIEAMRDSLYSSKSDVWSFAVLLWEIGTLGGFPYPTVADHHVLSYLQSGRRLEKPAIVSNDLYRMMLVCWSERPDDRPSFAELVFYLQPRPDRHVYVELLSGHQFPPTTECADEQETLNEK